MKHNVAHASDHLLPLLPAAPSATGKLLTAWAVCSMRPLFVAVLLLGVLVLGGCVVKPRVSNFEAAVWTFSENVDAWTARFEAYRTKQLAYNQRYARWRSSLTNVQADLWVLLQQRQNRATLMQFLHALDLAQLEEVRAFFFGEGADLAAERQQLREEAMILDQQEAQIREMYVQAQSKRERERASFQDTMGMLNTLNQIFTTQQLHRIERNTRR